MPLFFTQRSTYLIPKDQNNTQDPTKYKPITCLPTSNNIIAPEQKGCVKGAVG